MSLSRNLFILRREFAAQVCFSRGASNSQKEESSLVHTNKQFESVPPVKRNKETFMAAISQFKNSNSRSHVQFINMALKYIKDYGAHKDIDTYKALLNIFPKGKMIPQTIFQKVFLHYPMQQNCCVKVLDEMEWNAVQPDKEIHDIVVNAFGEWNYATKKIKRMLYWMPKLKYSNRYLDRRLVEGKSLSPTELAGIALKMMSRDPGTTLSLNKLPADDINGHSPWFATAQSLTQRNILSWLPQNTEIFIDGPSRVYVMDHPVYYITMTCEPLHTQYDEFKCEEFDEDFSHWFSEWKNRMNESKLSIHEQKEETILALGVLHKNDNQTASIWLEELQKTNPALLGMKMRMRLEKAT